MSRIALQHREGHNVRRLVRNGMVPEGMTSVIPLRAAMRTAELLATSIASTQVGAGASRASSCLLFDRSQP